MFKGISDLASLMKDVKQLQGKAAEVQESLGRLIVEGSAGGELVRVKASGLQRIVDVKVDPSLLASGDAEILEDLLVAAVNQALEKSREAAAREMSAGMSLPGLAEMMSRFGGASQDA